MKPTIALLDMDQTLADYERIMRRDLLELSGPEEPEYPLHQNLLPHIEARQNLIKRVPGWWRNLPKIESNFLVVDEMRKLGFHLSILTKGPGSKSLAWAEKLDWARAHVPDATVTITEDKSGVYGHVLFDDYPSYAEGWLKYRPRGIVIMPDHSYNRYFNHPRVYKYFGKSNLEEIKEVLTWARNRPSGEQVIPDVKDLPKPQKVLNG